MLPEKEWKVGDKVMAVAPRTSHVTVGTIADTSDWPVVEPGLVYIFITKMGATYGFPPEIVFPFNPENPPPMTNLEKAQAMVDHYLKNDYRGNLQEFQDENGYIDGVVQDVYFWLEDGNAEGHDVPSSLTLWIMSQ